MRIAYRDYYADPSTGDICHSLKEGSGDYRGAVGAVAAHIASQGVLGPDCVLVPAPQHTGRAEYTLDIARAVASATGCRVADVLGRVPCSRWYGNKETGLRPAFMLIGRQPKGRLFLVDNVVATGATYMEARRILGDRLVPLAYAIDYTAISEEALSAIMSVVEIPVPTHDP